MLPLKSIQKRLKRLSHACGSLLLRLGNQAEPATKNRNQSRYNDDMQKFQQLGGIVTHHYPILSDYDDQAGTASGHYFHQDLLVASLIHKDNPQRHIDIGSRIDGFVAHVASFRKIEVLDVRDLGNTGHDNIIFIRANLMDEANANEAVADSISCLHALEHFGLGRYGDPLDPQGHIKGFNNIVRMLQSGGTLYISFPIGKSNEVHFNAHRVFDPEEIFSWIKLDNRLSLVRFDYVDDQGALHKESDPRSPRPAVSYGCGIYTFKKH